MATLPTKWSASREICACAALIVAVLAGKLSLPLGRLGIELNSWTEIRLWSLLIGVVLFVPELRQLRVRDLLKPVMVGFVALVVYLLVRSVFDGGALTPDKQLDLVYLLIQAVLIAVAVLRAQRVKLLAYLVLGFALAYLAVATAGQIFEQLGSKVNFGLGWGPVGGPITFNRVQFLAFCMSMCLVSGSVAQKTIFASLAALFLFASLASLQKAAILAAIISIVFVGLWFLLTLRWRRLSVLVVVGLVASTSMFGIYGDRLSGRLERLSEPRVDIAATATAGETDAAVTLGQPAELDLPQVPIDPPSATQAAQTALADQSEVANPSASQVLIPPQPSSDFSVDALGVLVRYCVYEHPQVEGQPLPPLFCPAALFSDRSSRLTFWAEALRGWADSPLFGKGIAAYEITVPAPYTLLPDTYRYPHNLVLEIAYEAGAAGMLLLVAALALAGRSAWSSLASQQTRAYSATFMMFLFISALFSGDFYDSRLFWFGAMTLAFWKAADKRGT